MCLSDFAEKRTTVEYFQKQVDNADLNVHCAMMCERGYSTEMQRARNAQTIAEEELAVAMKNPDKSVQEVRAIAYATSEDKQEIKCK